MLTYSLEFSYDYPGASCSPGSPGCGATEACYVHIKHNPPIFIDRTRREAYEALDEEDKDEFLTGLFNTTGVTELSVTAYRIWVQKAPVFKWNTVLGTIISYLESYFEEDGSYALPGSANIDGTGARYNPPSSNKPL